jgi:hypothetical protein
MHGITQYRTWSFVVCQNSSQAPIFRLLTSLTSRLLRSLLRYESHRSLVSLSHDCVGILHNIDRDVASSAKTDRKLLFFDSLRHSRRDCSDPRFATSLTALACRYHMTASASSIERVVVLLINNCMRVSDSKHAHTLACCIDLRANIDIDS